MKYIMVGEVVHALACRQCGAESEDRKYVWKYKEKWVPFIWCYNCKKIVCEECFDTVHHCSRARVCTMISEGQKIDP